MTYNYDTMRPLANDHNKHLDDLETIVDEFPEGFEEFVELLAEVCSGKADHVSSNWQDYELADRWERSAAYLLNMTEAIEKSLVEHPFEDVEDSI